MFFQTKRSAANRTRPLDFGGCEASKRKRSVEIPGKIVNRNSNKNGMEQKDKKKPETSHAGCEKNITGKTCRNCFVNDTSKYTTVPILFHCSDKTIGHLVSIYGLIAIIVPISVNRCRRPALHRRRPALHRRPRPHLTLARVMELNRSHLTQ